MIIGEDDDGVMKDGQRGLARAYGDRGKSSWRRNTMMPRGASEGGEDEVGGEDLVCYRCCRCCPGEGGSEKEIFDAIVELLISRYAHQVLVEIEIGPRSKSGRRIVEVEGSGTRGAVAAG